MSVETRDTLLFGQLQEGLKYMLMKSLAVSDARNYNELFQAAPSEERRLPGLQQQQIYQHDLPKFGNALKRNDNSKGNSDRRKSASSHMSSQTITKTGAINDRFKAGKCWNCGKAGHIAADCRRPRQESIGQTEPTSGSRMVTSTETTGINDSDLSNKEARENRSGDSSPSDSKSDDPLLYLDLTLRIPWEFALW